MTRTRTTNGEIATEVVLATFRANGLLLEAGDRISARHALTSARWQVLGAVALAQRPLTVPQIARRMGLTRQSVHATIDRLTSEGVLERAPNEDHRRSHLVALTEHGKRVSRALDRDQAVWIDDLARGISRSDLETTRAVLEELAHRLETNSMKEPTRGDRVSAAREHG
jgi:DNA-binding MarR family transcriptional regulator